MNDHALDALLVEYAPPPLPAGLAGRVAAAALALPQEPRLAVARRAGAPPRRDRRGAWLRRPTLIAGVALGLVVSGAVAATLAGIRLPLVEAVLARLPFVDHEAPPPAAPPHPAPVQRTPAVVAAPAADEPVAALRAPESPALRAPAVRVEAPPATASVPAEAHRRPEFIESRRIELPPPAPPPPAVRREETASTPVAAPRAPAPAADERPRLQREQREQIERTERLRAARQARIERMQRLQQSRERIRRLRRD